MFRAPAVTLRFRSRRLRLVGELPVVLGREGVFPLRGPGISRRHASLDRRGATLVVSDLDSRNGTSVDGLLLESPLLLGGAARVGLGENLHLRVTLEGEDWLRLEVLDGMERGLRGYAGRGQLELADLPAAFGFHEDYPTLTPRTEAVSKLNGRDVVTPMELLEGDVIELDGVRVEVER
ncbi:MAG: FHA domain-containing protein [Deltaproteobacteria bacterium]|nr:FHA domain-containing protein [Deltaproteobacteria bacterium]